MLNVPTYFPVSEHNTGNIQVFGSQLNADINFTNLERYTSYLCSGNEKVISGKKFKASNHQKIKVVLGVCHKKKS
jgi:hypothetical protein